MYWVNIQFRFHQDETHGLFVFDLLRSVHAIEFTVGRARGVR